MGRQSLIEGASAWAFLPFRQPTSRRDLSAPTRWRRTIPFSAALRLESIAEACAEA
jgi:hypothetical protein